MDTNEIMKNEEVTEAVETVAEEITNKGSGKFKTAAIGGLTVLIGGLAVQYIAIPTIAKIRARKKNSDVIDAESHIVDDETSDDFDENSGEEE